MLATIDFGVVLPAVMTIAEEIDSQLSQAMNIYIVQSKEEGLPARFTRQRDPHVQLWCVLRSLQASARTRMSGSSFSCIKRRKGVL